ncbi:O-methylsterigmatocystin oxidoreductase [Grifola frondosa]|uniref:O-methylsterigmatocystin oxidoreductase n=1 Tax=Grifola frondosa TaxID=5627 RepID=A0A1C7MUH6_GRIFR|nr:O-methylsterigmatocystin oxidoreductase [Grifola frondosa]
MPYGPQWRKHRALFHQYFNAGNTSDYHPLQLKETHVMLRNLAESPDVIYHHVRRSAAAVVMKASYGHQIAPEGDIYVTLADEALTGLAQSGIFGTFLVDYIPLLKYIPAWMPGAGFQRKARAWRKANQSMLNMPFEMVKQRMASNTAVPCFVTAELERGFQSSSQEYDEQLIKDVAAIAYAAGADTTVSAILSFFLAMTAYPEVLKKLQGEIDRVVGNERLPDFSDRNSIPYVDWVVWECLRWNPVTPFGLAHQVIEDDVYDGYWIPKGTTIIPNVWGILHDETTYPDPLRFDPDRYADSKRNAELGINELPYPAFGFGRRMCPGRWLAIDSVWIAVATVAATFDVLKALDEKGVPQEPDIEYTSTLLSRPKSLRCRIVPRSDATAALISQTAEYV